MSGERTYPRLWFKVNNYGSVPEEREFVRETEKCLFWLSRGGGEVRQLKWTDYARWFPTREEAEALVAEREVKRDRQRFANRVRDAAPEIMEALEAAEKHFGPFADITINGQHDPEDVRVVALIRAAISKATAAPSSSPAVTHSPASSTTASAAGNEGE